MKRKNSIQPSKLWYVTSSKNLDSIKENGIHSRGFQLNLIHKLQFGTYPFEESDSYSSADCLALNNYHTLEGLQYALIEISPEGVKQKLKRCNTKGEVISKCAYVSDILHIEPEYIVSCEIRTVDINNLLCYNNWRLRNAMSSQLIQRKRVGFGLDKKEIAHNNRILNERHSAIHFNSNLLFLLRCSRTFKPSYKQSKQLDNAA
jgi:hypothetical protein